MKIARTATSGFPPIILASRSPWRKRLLRRHGIECRIHGSSFEELRRHKDPRFLVRHNAEGKAREVVAHYKKGLIIGVDTVGFIGKRILGKPVSRSEARATLLRLRGRSHRVITGLCIIDAASRKKRTAVEETVVYFKAFTREELENYLDCGQWKGKAGAYAIQGRARGFVEKIEGEVPNVVGLPIKRLKNILDFFRDLA